MTAPVSLSAHRARRQKPYPAVFELPPCDMPVVRPHEPESGAARMATRLLRTLLLLVLAIWTVPALLGWLAHNLLKGTP